MPGSGVWNWSHFRPIYALFLLNFCCMLKAAKQASPVSSERLFNTSIFTAEDERLTRIMPVQVSPVSSEERLSVFCLLQPRAKGLYKACFPASPVSSEECLSVSSLLQSRAKGLYKACFPASPVSSEERLSVSCLLQPSAENWQETETIRFRLLLPKSVCTPHPFQTMFPNLQALNEAFPSYDNQLR